MRSVFWLLTFALLISGSRCWSPEERPGYSPAPISSPLLCTLCKDTVWSLEKVFGIRLVHECLPSFIGYMCSALRIQTHTVCRGIVKGFHDEFIYVVGELLKKPEHLCGLFLPECDSGPNPLSSNWSIPIPSNKPAHQPTEPPEIGNSPALKVLHISDIHIDLNYAVGTEADCSEPQCCRFPPKTTTETKTIKRPAKFWGTVGNCDIPIWTFESLLKHSSSLGKIDYIVVSGDLESHADWEYSRTEHITTVRKIFTLFRKYFGDTPVFFAMGNHEAVPFNNLAPHYVPERFQMGWLYEELNKLFGNWIDEKAKKQFQYNGCFVQKVAPGLRVISLNSVYGDLANFYVYLNQTDPDGSMSWLANELLEAEKVGDKVQIVAHIPGGNIEMLPGWAINYYRVINRFEDTVVGQFFGHTHSELVYLTFWDPDDSTTRPTSVIYSGPSVTPYTNHNPAYRLYTIDGNRPKSTFKIIDWAEWVLDLEKAALTTTREAPWEVLYKSVREEYGLRKLEPDDWWGLAMRFRAGESTLQRYVGNSNRRRNKVCERDCAKEVVCSMLSAQKDKTGLCGDLRIQKEERDEKTITKLRENIQKSLKEFNAESKCPLYSDE